MYTDYSMNEFSSTPFSLKHSGTMYFILKNVFVAIYIITTKQSTEPISYDKSRGKMYSQVGGQDRFHPVIVCPRYGLNDEIFIILSSTLPTYIRVANIVSNKKVPTMQNWKVQVNSLVIEKLSILMITLAILLINGA